MDALNDLFKELEFDSFIMDKKTNVSESINDYKTIFSIEDFDILLMKLKKQKFVSLDLETTSLSPINAKIVGLSFSFSAGSGFYIPVSHAEDINQLDLGFVLKLSLIHI